MFGQILLLLVILIGNQCFTDDESTYITLLFLCSFHWVGHKKDVGQYFHLPTEVFDYLCTTNLSKAHVLLRERHALLLLCF